MTENSMAAVTLHLKHAAPPAQQHPGLKWAIPHGVMQLGIQHSIAAPAPIVHHVDRCLKRKPRFAYRNCKRSRIVRGAHSLLS